MIYLDNNATTFLSPEVLEIFKEALLMNLGNPSSVHSFGQKARGLLAQSKRKIAQVFGVSTSNILFSSGATEALNMLLRSAPKGRHIITSSLEHPAILEPLKHTGCAITYLDPLPGEGSILAHQIEQALRPDTTMIVLGMANSETGIKTDIFPIATLAKKANLTFVLDGVQILGKDRCDFPEGVSAVCFSGHKIHAPSGIGFSILFDRTKFHPLIFGGPQQHGMRGGTENLLGILALTRAIEDIKEKGDIYIERMYKLRNRFEMGLLEKIEGLHIHGKQLDRICNTSNIAFEDVEGEILLMRLDQEGVAVSHGSACSSGSLETSRVLLNMGISSCVAKSSIRFSLSRFTTTQEVDAAIQIISQIVNELKSGLFS